MNIQHPHIKAAQIREKLPGYGVARAHALNNQTLQHISARHREKFLKAFKYVQTNTIVGLTISNAIASCKHDGISSYFFWEKGVKPILFHCPSWGIEYGLPAADKLASDLEKAGYTNALIACEVIVANKRSHSYDVIHLINSPKNTSDLEKIHLIPLDALILNGKDIQEQGYSERSKLVASLPQSEQAHQPGFTEIKTPDDLNKKYKALCEDGQEGIVVFETTNGTAYKIKPKFNLDLAIVGFIEGTNELTGHVVSIMGALIDGDHYQLVARVGVADPSNREKLFKELTPNVIPSSYVETDSDGRPITWVKPTHVVEINAEDALWEDTDGKPWTNTVLLAHVNELSYAGQGTIVKPFHPTMERLREDKTPKECTFNQLPDAKLSVKTQATTKPATTLHREVYTKAFKGQTSLKKIIVWTQEGEGLPKVVIHTLDYSPTRKEPLEEDTKVTDNLTEAEAFVTNWRTEETGKGWVKTA